MDPGEGIEQTVVREVKEETGLDVSIVSLVGDYVEKGIQDGIEYEYYPTCFEVKSFGGELKKQDSEIQEIKAFSLDELPKPLAFEHEKMIEDWVRTKKTV